MSKYYEDQNTNENWDRKDDNDSEPVLTKYELDMLTIDEDQKATLYMYNRLKDYIDNRSFLFPIMDKMNITNFTMWFSENLDNDLLKKF
jgi:hypothetical protein